MAVYLPTLKQLQYLVALRDTGHFGRAADACFVTQSTLSAGLRELESLLGVMLVERTRRVVRFTPLGLKIANKGERVLREAVRGLVPDVARYAPKRGLSGLYEARLAQWRARGPAPFTPGAAFARFVDVSAMPPDDPTASVNEQLVHLRMRLLDRWLRAHAPSVVVAG